MVETHILLMKNQGTRLNDQAHQSFFPWRYQNAVYDGIHVHVPILVNFTNLPKFKHAYEHLMTARGKLKYAN